MIMGSNKVVITGEIRGDRKQICIEILPQCNWEKYIGDFDFEIVVIMRSVFCMVKCNKV